MTARPRSPLPRSLLRPRHWPAWLGVGSIYLLARLPRPALIRLGKLLGWIMQRIPIPRRRIATTNIALCFPELDSTAKSTLVNTHMRDVGLMFIEFALGWMGTKRAVDHIPVQIKGMQHLNAAIKQGQGVLLVGGHFSHLELCARLIAERVGIAGMYRCIDSPVFEWVILRARLRYAQAMFEKNDIRGAVKYLRSGGVLWYAPDQDMPSKNKVFVPFFGIPTATITATHHLARMGKAVVIAFQHRRLPGDSGYVIDLSAPLENFPSSDARADTARINTYLEEMVRTAPAQYLWVHKRFKSRPSGDPPVY